MKLEAEGQRAIVDPPSSAIQSAVSLLSPPDRTFLILSRAATSYIQVMIIDANRLVLEYREGGAEPQFRSARDDFSTGEVVEILEAYQRGEDSWRIQNEWRRIDVAAPNDPWDRVGGLFGIVGLVLMFDAFIAFKRAGRDSIFGLEPMDAFAIGNVASMAWAIVDLRKFRTMDAMAKVRAIGMIGVGVLVVGIQCLEHLTAR